MYTKHPDNPGLYLHKIKPGVMDGDGYDIAGDPWWRCPIHPDVWYQDFCEKCHPRRAKFFKICEVIIAVGIVGGLIAMIIHYLP